MDTLEQVKPYIRSCLVASKEAAVLECDQAHAECRTPSRLFEDSAAIFASEQKIYPGEVEQLEDSGDSLSGAGLSRGLQLLQSGLIRSLLFSVLSLKRQFVIQSFLSPQFQVLC